MYFSGIPFDKVMHKCKVNNIIGSHICIFVSTEFVELHFHHIPVKHLVVGGWNVTKCKNKTLWSYVEMIAALFIDLKPKLLWTPNKRLNVSKLKNVPDFCF